MIPNAPPMDDPGGAQPFDLAVEHSLRLRARIAAGKLNDVAELLEAIEHAKRLSASAGVSTEAVERAADDRQKAEELQRARDELVSAARKSLSHLASEEHLYFEASAVTRLLCLNGDDAHEAKGLVDAAHEAAGMGSAPAAVRRAARDRSRWILDLVERTRRTFMRQSGRAVKSAGAAPRARRAPRVIMSHTRARRTRVAARGARGSGDSDDGCAGDQADPSGRSTERGRPRVDARSAVTAVAA